jgi:hypothetical protein
MTMQARRQGLATPARRLGNGVAGAAGVLVGMLLLATAARADTPPPPLTVTAITTFVNASSAPVGGSITDTAVVVHGAAPTGTVTFTLYGANDTKCAAAPVSTQTVPFALPAMSPPYTPTKAGVYTWVASYSGDANNAPISGLCGDPGETVTVTALTPTIAVTASPTTGLGGTINASATLSGGYNPTGTITFKLYGVTDQTCAAAPIFTMGVPVAKPATVSTPVKPVVAGTYHFIATYNGDAANNPVSTGCGDAGAAVVVTAPGQSVAPPAAGATPCNAGVMAQALLTSLVAVLTGGPNQTFKASCSAGVRIVLRAKEIRPGHRGTPNGDGFTTIANTLTHSTTTGAVAFGFNSQGTALRKYATAKGVTLTVFAVVHVRPDRTLLSSEAVQIFGLG